VSFLDQIVGYLRTNYKPGPGEFSRFDGPRLVESFELREKGAARGAKDQPPADAKDLDVVEQDIVEAMRVQALDDERRTREQLEFYDERLKNAAPAGQAAAMFVEAQNAVANFRNSMVAARARLGHARAGVIEREQAMALFKARNGLDRPPHPAKSHWAMAGVLIVLVALEIAFNATVLSSGSEFGWAGGITLAVFFTVISAAAAFTAGLFGVPFTLHRKAVAKFFGFAVTIICLAALGFVNLLAAHYRLAIEDGVLEPEAMRLAPETLFGDPLAFTGDTYSLLMVGFSAVVALIAFLDGLFWQDPYPGYERVRRNHTRANNRWLMMLRLQSNDLEGIYSRHAKQIRALQASLQDQQTIIPQTLHHRRRLVNAFNAHLKHIQWVGAYLLQHYREANVETRKSKKPKYFERPWQFDAVPEMPMPEEFVPGEGVDGKDVGRQLIEASKALNDAHEEAVIWIEALSTSDSIDAADEKVKKLRNAKGGVGRHTAQESREEANLGEDIHT
jgi:hypothetical protein